jgi:hypothetical protein
MDQNFKRFNNEKLGKMNELRPVGNASFNESNFLLLGGRNNNLLDPNKDKLLLNKSSSINSPRDEENNPGILKIKGKKYENGNLGGGTQFMIDQNINKKLYAEDESDNLSLKKQKSKRKLTKRDKIVNRF